MSAVFAEAQELAAAGSQPARLARGRTWLHLACEHGQLQVARLLLRFSALFQVDATDEEGGRGHCR